MRPQMKYADRRLSPVAVIIGGDEFAAGTVTLKDLDLGRELASGVTDNAAWRAERPGQRTVPRAELVAEGKKIAEGQPGGSSGRFRARCWRASAGRAPRAA